MPIALRYFKISWTNLKLRELPGNVPGKFFRKSGGY
jgi:hypothetical protein